ncbi:Glutathione S-transferase Mu 1 [Saguinus oedipus]|uniref:glutathione transferase n=1 Tax=Saguinus oedipus TaxID=9490 RepID=A0ABQ9VC67_SAGOE|nr:Glutathione S-transferase Mu 1 [Saguinus oedipus]
MGVAPDYDRSQWLKEKFKLGLDFPNGMLGRLLAQLSFPGFPSIQLPYLIDGAHKITQSNAILRYIARKHNLCGETEEEKIRVDILENQAMDVSNQLARVCYSPDFADSHYEEKLKPEYLEGIPPMMQHFSQFLGKGPWFVGDKITFVDFLAYDILDLHRIFEPTCLDAFPNLKDFISRFEKKPQSSSSLGFTAQDTLEGAELFRSVDAAGSSRTGTRLCDAPALEPRWKGCGQGPDLHLQWGCPSPHGQLTLSSGLIFPCQGLEKISAYMKSSRFLPRPLYTRVAVWGNK